MYSCKEMVKILKCYLIPKKSYGTLSEGAIVFGQSCRSVVLHHIPVQNLFLQHVSMLLVNIV